jgi:hypothetical protein
MPEDVLNQSKNSKRHQKIDRCKYAMLANLVNQMFFSSGFEKPDAQLGFQYKNTIYICTILQGQLNCLVNYSV